MQLVINPERAADAAAAAHELRNEFVVRAPARSSRAHAETVNPRMPTGEIEVQVDELDVISALDAAALPARRGGRRRDVAHPLPLARPAARADAAEHPHARTRRSRSSGRRWRPPASSTSRRRSWASRRPRAHATSWSRRRLQPGRFFALPQSPQIYKQLLVISGLRALLPDRPLLPGRGSPRRPAAGADPARRRDWRSRTTSTCSALIERIVARIWRECRDVELETPFPRMTWEEADLRYGSDKPDLRFGLEIEEATELTRGSEFGVFASARGRALPPSRQELSRGEIAKLEELAKSGVREALPRSSSGRRRGELADREVPLR